MKQPTQLEMFGLLHPEIESQTKTKLSTMSEPNTSNQVHSHSFYVKKVTNTPINI